MQFPHISCHKRFVIFTGRNKLLIKCFMAWQWLINSPYAWWCHAFSGNIKTRLGEDFAGIQEEYRTCLLEIALMQDDVTKFPLNTKVRLGGDQNQVVTVIVLSIFHFVEFPTDMLDMYYIPLEFLGNLCHQVSFWCYQTFYGYSPHISASFQFRYWGEN